MSDVVSESSSVRAFLIADIRGYTSFTQAQGDEAAGRLAGRFAEVMRDVVESHGGALVELRGDEAMCVFESPRGALRAAVAVQRRCADELRADRSLPLRVGIGIDAGEAVSVEGGFRGKALNLAARLCSRAAAGEVLVSEGVVHLAGRVDDLTYRDRGRVELKGIAEPVRILQVGFDLDLLADEARSRSRLSAGRVAMVVTGAVVVAGGAVFAGLRGGGASPALAANAVASLGSSGGVATQTILPGGGRPAGIASVGDAIWVTDAGRGIAVEVDPTSGVLKQATQPLGTAPSGIAVGGGGIWVSDSAGAVVRWVNEKAPTTPPTAIAVGQGPGPIAYGDGAAWVVNAIDGTLQRLSGPGEKASAPVPVGAEPTAVAVAFGSVWVADGASDSVVRIDAASLRVTDRISVGSGPSAVASGGDAVWVANGANGTVTRIQPGDDRTRTISVGGRPVGIAYASGAVWLVATDPSAGVRIDPTTFTTRTTTLASPPQAISAAGGRAWITSVASPASHRGGTLRVLFGGDPGNSPFGKGFHPFDPGAAPYAEHFSLLHMTNDGLLSLRRIGGSAGLQLVPDLAVALPAVSDSGRTLVFRIRPGIHYSNGKPVKPSDFLNSMRRIFLHPKVSYGAYFFTDIVGTDICHESLKKCPEALAQGIQPNDKTGTLTIHLLRPDPGFPYELATTFASLLPPDAPQIYSGKPVPATGPYMVAKAGKLSFTVVRNPRFQQWSADAQPDGFPATMRWTFQPDPGKALTEIEQGKADVMLDDPPADRLAELRTRYAVLAHPWVALDTRYLGLNSQVPPFSSLAARQALNFAVDRRRITQFPGATLETPTCQVLPPGLFGYSPYCPYTRDANPQSGVWRGPDLRRAKRLVAQSGTAGSPVQVWSCTCIGVSRGEAHYITSVINRLGYRAIDHSVSDYGAYADGTSQPRAPVVNIEGWISDFPFPSNFFDPLLECSSPTEPSTKFCDAKLDDLVARAKRATGPAAHDLWAAADRRAVDQAAWVPLTNGGGISVVSSKVGDYQRNPQLGMLLDQFWLR